MRTTKEPTRPPKKVISVALKYDMDGRSYDALYSGEQTAKLEAALDAGWAPGKRLVDIGCGTALLTSRLARGCDLAVGLDISSGMLRRAKLRKRVELVRGDASHIPLRPGSFTSCVCFTSFHHFREKPRAIDEMAGLVRHGGSVVFSLLARGAEPSDELEVKRSRRLETVSRLSAGNDSLLIMERL
jgi:demethylmenaquinone methyltransferase/2-methoxy-6-polyprenyl-1,4-benzoquinol methylase